jgi:acetyl-CoA C-acetyltransferase
MRDVFVVDAVRTPFGSFNGALAEEPAPRLASTVIRGLLARTGLPADAVGEVIAGQILSGGNRQGPARQALRGAGIPDSVPAMSVNKLCGSGLKAMMLAAGSIRLGDVETAVAGGMETMSLAPYLLLRARQGYRLGHGELVDSLLHDGLHDAYDGRHMGEMADLAAVRYGFGRAEQDEYALRSYRLAQRAVSEGIFDEEIVPVKKARKGAEQTIDKDEEPFRVDLARFSSLRPAFGKEGTVTAGNASTLNDGAAFALLASEAAVKAHGLRPRARLVSYATNSVAPERFTDAPADAVRRACAAAGVAPANVDLFEINEAFAVVALIAARELDLPLDKLNVNGGAVALGHPVGASGGRLVATLVREMHRRNVRHGVAALCIGGGEAVAAVLERV